MLKALRQHLADLNIKEVRDGVVKLWQLSRIMMEEGELSGLEELDYLHFSRFEPAGGGTFKLGRCTLCWRCRQAYLLGSPSRLQTAIRRV